MLTYRKRDGAVVTVEKQQSRSEAKVCYLSRVVTCNFNKQMARGLGCS
jgi:hypothetical protein